MSTSGGAAGTHDTDNESNMSFSFSESESSDASHQPKKARRAPLDTINKYANATKPCNDCIRYSQMSDDDLQNLKTLITTH